MVKREKSTRRKKQPLGRCETLVCERKKQKKERRALDEREREEKVRTQIKKIVKRAQEALPYLILGGFLDLP